MNQIKLSISNIAWNSKDDEDIYKYMSDYSFDGLEIAPSRIFIDNPYKKLSLAKKFSKELKDKYDLEISSLQSILFGREEHLFGSNAEQHILLNYAKMAIDFAEAVNCHNLVFGSPKNRVIENYNQFSIAIDFFKKLGNHAVQKNTIISIEPNPQIYGTNFINTTKQAFELVNNVNNPGFMVNVDLGTIIHNKENIKIVIKNIHLVNHIHISEPNLVMIKKRSIHKELAHELKIIGYNKYVSIEMKNTGNINDVKQTIEYIGEIFNAN